MESLHRKGMAPPRHCGVTDRPQSASFLKEGISILLSRWHGLQIAVQNQWGGFDSRKKSEQLASDILTWFSSYSKERLYIEDLENLLHETMLFNFNTDMEDGSIEEVAEQLMIMHEGYLQEAVYDNT